MHGSEGGESGSTGLPYPYPRFLFNELRPDVGDRLLTSLHGLDEVGRVVLADLAFAVGTPGDRPPYRKGLT